MRFHQKLDIPETDKRAVVRILDRNLCLFYFLLLLGGVEKGGGKGEKRRLLVLFFPWGNGEVSQKGMVI